MPPTISTVRAWRLDDLTSASTVATGNARAIAVASGRIDKALLGATGWSGHAQRAAKHVMTVYGDHAAEVTAVLQSLASTASDAHRELVPARDQVLLDVKSTVEAGFVVSDTGTVTVPADDDADDDTRADREATAKIWENRISLALIEVGTLDAAYGRKFTTHATDLAGLRDGQAPIILADGTTADPDAVVVKLAAMTALQRRAFLATLTADDIRQLVIADPKTMGNLDGVPFLTRIAANDINIRTALADEIAAGRGDGDRAKKLTEMLTPVSQTNRGFGDTTKVRRQFIAFSNSKVGNSIEMVGELNSSTRNAAVYVPGTNSNLNGSQTNYQAARNLSQRTGGPVFVYLDERLPQKMGYEGLLDGGKFAATNPSPIGMSIGGALAVGGLHNSAFDAGPAKSMAGDLVSFGEQLDTELAQTAPTAKTTFIGHSYGGAVVGTAEQLGLRADRVIYASSAGTGALNTGWHNTNPNVERYSLTAPGDPIHIAQETEKFGPDPDTTPGVMRLDTGFYASGNHAGELVSGSDGHGGYWNDPESTAFKNMVAVITGDTPTEYEPRVADTPAALTRGFSAARIGAVATAPVTGPGPLIGVEMLRRWLSSE